MTELVTGKLGAESTYDVDLVEGYLVATVKYDGAQLDGSVQLNLDVVAILEILKAKIPGSIDDGVISFVQAAIKSQGA